MTRQLSRAPRLFALLLSAAGAAEAGSLALTHAGSAYADETGAALRGPEGVACTDNGYVVVADSGNNRLVKYTFAAGRFGGGTPIGFAELGYPTRVQIDRRGNVLSLDQRTRRIVRVGAAGGFAGFVEMKNVPSGKGFFPVAFKLDAADNAYVVELASARLILIDAAGAFVRQVPLPAGTFIADVAIDAAGTLYVVDAVGGAVWSAQRGSAAFAPFSNGLKEYLNQPIALALAPPGQLLVVDRGGNGLVVLGRDGSFQGRQLSMGWNDGLVYYPGQTCADANGTVFVADRDNNRVQAFTSAQ